MPAISHAVSKQLEAAIAALTGPSFAPAPSLASGKRDPYLSPALSSPNVIVPEQHAVVEEVTMECITATSKRC